MLIRALIVLLLMLNLGVAAWWYWSSPAVPSAPVMPADVARLQLVRERDARSADPRGPDTRRTGAVAATSAPSLPADSKVVLGASTAAGAASASAATPAPATPRCHAFGPFTGEDELVLAQGALKPLVQILAVRRVPPRAGRGWRVHLPPLATAEEATAAAGRIAAAGFRDYFIVREGAEANSVALGRFGTETAARRHADALNAAGFPARAEPLGAGTGTAWVEVRAGGDFDAAAARAQSGASQQRVIDCIGVP